MQGADRRKSKSIGGKERGIRRRVSLRYRCRVGAPGQGVIGVVGDGAGSDGVEGMYSGSTQTHSTRNFRGRNSWYMAAVFTPLAVRRLFGGTPPLELFVCQHLAFRSTVCLGYFCIVIYSSMRLQ